MVVYYLFIFTVTSAVHICISTNLKYNFIKNTMSSIYCLILVLQGDSGI